MTADAVEYIESERILSKEDGDALLAMSQGCPYLFLWVHHEGDGLGIKIETGGGVHDSAMVRKILRMALEAIPE